MPFPVLFPLRLPFSSVGASLLAITLIYFQRMSFGDWKVATRSVHIFHELPGLTPSSSAPVGSCVCCSDRFLYSLTFAPTSFLCLDWPNSAGTGSEKVLSLGSYQLHRSPQSSPFLRVKNRRHIPRCRTIQMPMGPMSPRSRTRSLFLASRFLLLSSVRRLQGGRLEAAATRQGHGS